MRLTKCVFLLLLVVLAACGTSASPSAGVAPASVAQATLATTANAPSATSSAIPEGLTAEGYHMLGRSDAPVTMTFYSDFF